jgi:iron complex outermembrane recepter protein
MTKFKLNFWLASAMASATVLAGNAHAQQADSGAAESDDRSDEIVVTAQFREQDLQKTPLAITAVNAAMLESRGVDNLLEVAQTSPNVTLAPGAVNDGKSVAAFIRGIGQVSGQPAFEPGVSIYIDDVYYSTVYGSAFDLVDLDRIEILRGPQGTLSGKNSIGGSVKLFSRVPDGEGKGSVQVGYGSHGALKISANADLTLIPEKLFLGISGLGKSGGGYVDRVDYGCRFPTSGVASTGGSSANGCKLGTLGNESIAAGRIFLRALPTDNLEIRIIADVTKDSSGGTPDTAFFAGPSGFFPGIDLTQYRPTRRNLSYATYTAPSEGPSVAGLAFEPKSRADNWGISGSIDYKLGDDFSFKSITAYRELDGRFTTDGDASPVGLYTGDLAQYSNQFTQEFRLNGAINDIFTFTLGGFYFKGKSSIDNRARGFATFDQLQNDAVRSESKAAFAHGELEITPGLKVLGGIRFTDEKKKYTFIRREANSVPYGLFGLFGVTAAINNVGSTFSGNRIDWRVGASYQIAPEVMVYGQVATGYKGGGINPRPFYAQQVVPFNPETLTTYEMGVKARFADNRVRLNLAGFYSDYANILVPLTSCPQLVPPGAPPLCSLITNGGAAKIKGFEVETTIEPVENFQIDGSLGYVDFGYKTSLAALGIGAVIPFTPKWTVSAGVQYKAELGGSAGSLTPRIDWTYRSAVFFDASNALLSREPGYSLFNGRITWRAENSDWELGFAVTNLFNKEYYLNRQTAFAGVFGVATGVPGRPREFAASIKRSF